MIFQPVWNLSVISRTVVEEQCRSVGILLFLRMIRLIQMFLDDGIEPVGHDVVSLFPEASQREIRHAEKTQVLLFREQSSSAHYACPWQQQVRRSVQCLYDCPCHASKKADLHQNKDKKKKNLHMKTEKTIRKRKICTKKPPVDSHQQGAGFRFCAKYDCVYVKNLYVCYQQFIPPQQLMTWPVTYLERSLARKSATSATSSGVPPLLKGICFSHS